MPSLPKDKYGLLHGATGHVLFQMTSPMIFGMLTVFLFSGHHGDHPAQELSLLETDHWTGGSLLHQHGRLSGRGSLLHVIHSENQKQNNFRIGDFVREKV